MSGLVAITAEGAVYQLKLSPLPLDKLRGDMMRTFQIIHEGGRHRRELLRPSLPSGHGVLAEASFRRWADAHGHEVREVIRGAEGAL